jgi:hypothetical protein
MARSARITSLVVVAVLLGAAVASPASGAMVDGQATATTDGEIVRTMTFSLTPDEPGTVDVVLSYRIPDTVEELESTVPSEATVLETDGFSPSSDGYYAWDGRTETPSIRFSLPANRTGEYQYEPQVAENRTGHVSLASEPPQMAEDSSGHVTLAAEPPDMVEAGSGLLYADTGPWALVAVPAIGVSWTYLGTPTPTVTRRVVVDGTGVAGSQMVFLGPHTKQTRTIDDQRVTLVVPDAARLEPSPTGVLDAVEAASESLQVGEKPERILLVAAPTSVDWGPGGLARGDDAWVRADRPLDDPNNVWLHEYVHVVQAFETAESARWTTEAMGEYYAALLTLEQGRIGFEAFADHLEMGADRRYDDVVLSQPDTWTHLANYVKGGLVFGNLDRRMRLATDGSEPASHLLRAMNERDRAITHGFLADRVDALAGTDPAGYLDQYATTASSPSMWSRSQHSAAFSTLPPRIVSTVADAYTIEGPYRNTSREAIPTLVPGERLTFDVTLSNEGEASGSYTSSLLVDGTSVSTASGTLAGGANTTVEHHYIFEEPGSHELSIGSRTWNVTVSPPATPTVAALSASAQEVSPGQTVALNLTARNDADRPATGNLSVTVDGAAVQTQQTRLDVGESVRRTVQVTLDGPGVHTIAVDGRSVQVTVVAPTTTPGTTGTTVTTADTATTEPNGTSTTTGPTVTPTTTPGPGVLITAFALVLGLSLLRVRQSRR